MKKIMAVLLAAVMGMFAFTACSNGQTKGKSLKSGTTMKQICQKIDEDFGEDGAVAMPAEIDSNMLNEQYYVNPEDVAEFYGTNSMSMTNSDAVLAVKAKSADKVDAIKSGLEKRKADLESQFEQYPVNGSYERAKAAEVYVQGDCVFFLCVGMLPQGDYNDEDLNFPQDVAKAKGVIDTFFE